MFEHASVSGDQYTRLHSLRELEGAFCYRQAKKHTDWTVKHR